MRTVLLKTLSSKSQPQLVRTAAAAWKEEAAQMEEAAHMGELGMKAKQALEVIKYRRMFKARMLEISDILRNSQLQLIIQRAIISN